MCLLHFFDIIPIYNNLELKTNNFKINGFLSKNRLENLQTLVLSKCDAMFKYFQEMEREMFESQIRFPAGTLYCQTSQQ